VFSKGFIAYRTVLAFKYVFKRIKKYFGVLSFMEKKK